MHYLQDIFRPSVVIKDFLQIFLLYDHKLYFLLINNQQLFVNEYFCVANVPMTYLHNFI